MREIGTEVAEEVAKKNVTNDWDLWLATFRAGENIDDSETSVVVVIRKFPIGSGLFNGERFHDQIDASSEEVKEHEEQGWDDFEDWSTVHKTQEAGFRGKNPSNTNVRKQSWWWCR